MDSVQRVVIRDKAPVFDGAVLHRAAGRAAVAAAFASLLVQGGALVEVLLGHGKQVAFFDHAAFSVVAFLWLIIGGFVFLQRRGNRAGVSFLLSAVAGSIFLSLGTLYTEDLAHALLYTTGFCLFPPLLYSFARSAVEPRSWTGREALVFVPSLLVILPSAEPLANNHVGLAWRIALVFVAGYLIGAIGQAGLDLRNARTAERAAQARALLAGLTVGTAPGIVLFVFPLVITGSLTVTTVWLPPLILLFLLVMSYAVLLYEFSEADLIVRRGVVYGILTLLMVLAYGALGVVLAASRSSVTSPGGGLAFVAVTVIIGAAFGPIHYVGRRSVDWLLYGQPTERWELLQALSARLATIVHPNELGEVLVREVASALHLRGAFLLQQEADGDFVIAQGARMAEGQEGAVSASELRKALLDPPLTLLLLHGKPLTAARHEGVPSEYLPLDRLGVSLAVPLLTRAGRETVLCLQPKLSHDTFDRDDLELLAPVIRQATAALDNALLVSRLEEKIEELRTAYRRIAGEQEAERARLARELHDGTAQEIAGLITLAAVMDRQLGSDEGPVRGTLSRLARQAEEAYQGVRRSSHALRPPMLDDFGLAPTLSQYVEQFHEATGIAVSCRIDETGSLPDDVELALFRVTQECLENVRKHSGSRQASLSLYRENGHVRLTVDDSGRGLPERPKHGLGLSGMRERVESVGGSIKVESERDRGVRVAAIVPVGSER